MAEQLITRGQVQVPIGKTKYKLKISPYMRGNVTNLQVRVRTLVRSGTHQPQESQHGLGAPESLRGVFLVPWSPLLLGDHESMLAMQYGVCSSLLLYAQLQPSRCTRTVLLSGIPDVLAEEPMRDALEIHFQKDSRGGGEVDVLGYVPAGRRAVAVFREDVG